MTSHNKKHAYPDTVQRLLVRALADEPVADEPTTNRPHPADDDDLLLRWSEGRLAEGEHAAVVSHLADCSECREILAAMIEADVWHPATPPAEDDHEPSGDGQAGVQLGTGSRADRARWLGWALVAGGLAAGLFIAISAWSLWDGEPHGPPHGPLAESERSLVEIERQLVEQRPANPPDTLVDQPWSENGSERAVGPRTPSPPVVAQESVVSELERQNDERRLPGGIASQEKDLLVEPAGSGRLWAIVVGVDEYQHLPSLSFGVSDAQGLVRTLRQFGDIPEDHILLITDATGMKPTRDVLLEQIPRWLQNCQPQDTLLFFFSGHGVIHPRTQRMYLASADCRIDDIGQSAVGISRIRQLLARCEDQNPAPGLLPQRGAQGTAFRW